MLRFSLCAVALLAFTTGGLSASLAGLSIPTDPTVHVIVFGLSLGAVWAATA